MIKPLYYTNPGYCPHNARDISAYLVKNGIKPAIVRISTRYIQVYTLKKPDIEVKLLKLLKDYSASHVEFIDIPEHQCKDTIKLQCLLSKYYYHMNIEAFWEAHEDGENLWSLGLPQGQLLAVVAGALAKAQEGFYEPVAVILYNILPKVLEGQSGLGVYIDLNCLESEINRILACSGQLPKSNCIIALSPIISYRRK